MIPIRARYEELPSELKRLAAELTEKIESLSDDPTNNPDGTPRQPWKSAREKRKELIERNSGFWGKLKPYLEQWSYKKCWYSEVREIGSDYHVDHFRPKNRVTEHPEWPGNKREEEGYWWLAFYPGNYRLASAFCNSPHRADEETLGKSDYFPLCLPEKAVFGPGPLTEELPVLPDPLSVADTRLISFNEQGRAVTTAPKGSDVARRVELGIKILNLNAVAICEERSRIWRRMGEVLDWIDECLAEPLARQGHIQDRHIDKLLAKITQKTAPDCELCGAARAAVRKSGHDIAIEKIAPLDGTVLADPDRWKVAATPTTKSTDGDEAPASLDRRAVAFATKIAP